MRLIQSAPTVTAFALIVGAAGLAAPASAAPTWLVLLGAVVASISTAVLPLAVLKLPACDAKPGLWDSGAASADSGAYRGGERGIAPRLSGRPPPLATFCGREAELRDLLDSFRRLRRSGASSGAIILAIHGMPGVGKSALGHELARQLTPDFPDGQLYANLGNAGSIRAEADILNRFLMALGVHRHEIPPSTLDRAALYRSATSAKRFLVILDAARDHQQVARLLPSGEGCAVIVTSRRDLGPALGVRSLLLRVPEMDSALDILRAVSNTEYALDQKSAIEIVHRVGRLPLAIRAAGDMVVQQLRPLNEVAGLLRVPDQRDAVLRNQGRGVEERIDSEYGRLTTEEQDAFRLLSLIDSPSFLPWVLLPLGGRKRNFDYAEAEKLISRLAERQLLELAGLDEVTGIDRYRFHPVTHVFAEHRRENLGEAPEEALRRVDDAYLEVIDLALAEVDPQYRQGWRQPSTLRWYPEGSSIPRRIAEVPDRVVRAEYRNLVRCVRAAHDRERWGLCWQIAARLGISVPDEVDRQSVLAALELGQAATAADRSRRGLAQVLLGRGRFLARLEEYEAVYQTFADAALVANQIRSAGVGPRVPGHRRSESIAVQTEPIRLECEAYRGLAEAHLRLGAFRDAAHELNKAGELARLAQDDRQLRLVALMRIHLGTSDGYGDVVEPRCTDNEDDDLLYWRESAAAELERRNLSFGAAADRLRLLRHWLEDDAGRNCLLLARIAELRLEELQRVSTNAERARRRAVDRAAEAVYGFQRIGQAAGTIRARCLLSRALLNFGRDKDAEEQWISARDDLRQLGPAVNHDYSPLMAALWRAEGELLIVRGTPIEGRTALVKAARVFHAHGDRAAEANTLAVLGLDRLPTEAFDTGPLGRDPDAWLEGADTPLRLGRSFDVAYTIKAPALIEGHYPAGGRYLSVVFIADGADVEPTVRIARLDSWAPLPPLRFRVTPRAEGLLRMGLMVYAADDGSLLQASELRPRVVVTSTHKGVTA